VILGEAVNEPVLAGYSMVALEELARWAARGRAIPAGENPVEVAWSAIVEHLAAGGSTTPHQLVHLGRMAIYQSWNDDAKHAGLGDKRSSRGGTGRQKYWWWLYQSKTRGPEDILIEPMALGQIWTRLSELDRRVLTAFAVHATHGAAAAALDMTYFSFCQRLRRARRHFLAFWFEGGPVPRQRQDRRVRSYSTPDRKLCSTPGCYAPHLARGLCNRCYLRAKYWSARQSA